MGYEIKKPSEATLERTVGKAQKFLGGLSKHPEVLAILQSGDKPHLLDEDYEQGWELVVTAIGYRNRPTSGGKAPLSNESSDAIAELDNNDEKLYKRVHLALQGDFADAHNFIFQGGIGPKKGPEAVGSVTILLERIINLRDDPQKERQATRAQDAAAIQAIEKMGLDDAEITRLQSLIQKATKAPSPQGAKPALDPAQLAAQQQEASEKVFYWFKKWSEMAHEKIQRRDYLRFIGLAEFNRDDDEEEPKGEDKGKK